MQKGKEISKKTEKAEIIIYTSQDGDVKIEVVIENESLWLSQKKVAELFDVKVPAISKHLNNIFEEGELEKIATVSNLETVRNEGGREVKRNIELYNLDAIIAVGYRVNSMKATQFRIWATKILKEYLLYQVKTLSPVEKSYLDSIKVLHEKVKKNKTKIKI